MEPEVFIPAFTIARHLSWSWTRSSDLCPIPLTEDPFSYYLQIYAGLGPVTTSFDRNIAKGFHRNMAYASSVHAALYYL